MNIEKAKKIFENEGIRQALWLIKNGIPYDVALSLDDEELFAYCIIFSELEGSKFNWKLMRFEEPKK